jgi:shikimate kinase/3-dehydroquinate synthase
MLDLEPYSPLAGATSRPVVLVGLPGSGKSTVARWLAERLGIDALDADEAYAERFGEPPATAIRRDGEAAFRTRESALLESLLAPPAPGGPARVIAAGGGVVEVEENRRLLAERAWVVWLRVETELAVARIVGSGDRPLLGDDPASALARLAKRRSGWYREVAKCAVDASARPEVLGALVAAGSPPLWALWSGPWPSSVGGLRAEVYLFPSRAPGEVAPVVVAPGALGELERVLDDRVRTLFVIADRHVAVDLPTSRRQVRVPLEAGEAAKSLGRCEELWRRMAAEGVQRSDAVVGLGGGTVTDLAGFVAACYHRGIDVVQAPTTVLAQADAALGGKTGVNLPEGKNLVGAFWPPSAVLSDCSTLETLPERERRSGLAEVAKHVLLGAPDGVAGAPAVFGVLASAVLKGWVVAGDEREAGSRAALNLGHTLAHALETEAAALGVDLRHGEAVSIGLAFVGRLAERLGVLPAGGAERFRAVPAALGLPVGLPTWAEPAGLLDVMARDKKASVERRFGLPFVLPTADGGVALAPGVPEVEIEAALASWWD